MPEAIKSLFGGGKNRLYIVLYARNESPASETPHWADERPEPYIWAFMLSPKVESSNGERTVRYRLTHNPEHPLEWVIECIPISPDRPEDILGRVLVAKVKDMSKFDETIHRGTSGTLPLVISGAERVSRLWVKIMLRMFENVGALGRRITDWRMVEKCCTDLVLGKLRESDVLIANGVPTYDMLVQWGKQTVL